MHDQLLDRLSDFLIRLSRVPGLGFLENHATAATRLKHNIEGHLGEIGERQQGLEEGAELMRETFGRKPKPPPNAVSGDQPAAPAATDPAAMAPAAKAPAAATSPAASATASSGKLAKEKLRSTASTKSHDAKLKQKLAMQHLKRRRF